MNREDPIGVVTIDLPSRLDLVTVVRMIVASASFAADSLGGDRLDDLRWVCSEATTNAIQANMTKVEKQGGALGRVTVSCEVGDTWVRLIVVDQGLGLPTGDDPIDMSAPDRLDLEGGFGIPLMRTLATGEVEFEWTGEGTKVTLELHRRN